MRVYAVNSDLLRSMEERVAQLLVDGEKVWYLFSSFFHVRKDTRYVNVWMNRHWKCHKVI